MDPLLEKKLKDARLSLLDLTLRNRLINYRSTKARSLRLLEIDCRSAMDTLVNQGKSISIHGRVDLQKLAPPEEPFLRLNGLELATTDMDADAAYEPDVLLRRLRELDSDARTLIEDRGYNVLYVALGFLEWQEAESSGVTFRAPLVLVPVELECSVPRSTWRFKWSNGDVVGNLSLEQKLQEQRIELPAFDGEETAADIDAYYGKVRDAVPKEWRVLDLTVLDLFSFARASMYRDLDPKAWDDPSHIAANPLIRGVLLRDPLPGSELPAFDPDTIDDTLQAADFMHVVDADPSQIAVIEDAKSGKSLVVEGPPGTGKSQTIVNIVAELVGQGKTVLFVSQKMAALDVVKERLDATGLGIACLELHSNKATKVHFLEQLRQVTEQRVCPGSVDATDYTRVDQLRKQLGDYARAIREPIGNAGRSPYALFGAKEQALSQLRATLLPLETLPLDGVEAWTAGDVRTRRQSVLSLAGSLKNVGSVRENPWRQCKVGLIMPNELPGIGRSIDTASEELLHAERSMSELAELGIPVESSFAAQRLAVQAAWAAADAPQLDVDVAMSDAWERGSAEPTALVEAVHSLQEERGQMRSIFRGGLSLGDVEAIVSPFNRLCEEHRFYESFLQKVTKLFNREYRVARRAISQLTIMDIRKTPDRTLHGNLSSLVQMLSDAQCLEADKEKAKTYFGGAWKGEDSSPDQLRSTAHWMAELALAVSSKRLGPRVFEAVTHPQDERIRQRDGAVKSMASAESMVQVLYKQLNDVEDFDLVDKTDLKTLLERLKTWRLSLDLLPSWCQYVLARKDCLSAVGQDFIRTAESGQFYPDELSYYFDACVADTLLRKAFNERPALARFSGATQESAIREYVDLDQRTITANRRRLTQLAEDRRPARIANPAQNSAAAIVRDETNRKRPKRPIRTLMKEAGGYIQSLKPCFLMSPLSIAQYLDPTMVSFDCIIFDEASQVKPEEALGALLRGKQLIVMGDTKQLPPTNFFEKLVADEEDPDDADDVASVSPRDMESILHMCKTVFSESSQLGLHWHYRSRHESLIAVSNREFYRDELMVYPSAISEAPGLGLSFAYVEDGVYDRGRSRTNRIEAKEVARRVAKHFQERPELSLGVGTFNIQQQRAIEDELAILRQSDPHLDTYFDHNRPGHCFIKNIETIQGDERDVIFVSVGYGKDENGGFTQNFGPVNQEGGERRLNVLMTRSRIQCVMFANFHADMIQADRDNTKGLYALKEFLQYAETRTFQVNTITSEEADSGFEEAVGEFLKEEGYDIRRQVGCAQFRIDIGIVDRQHPGEYLCGVECDGRMYHSSRVARDRDRLRQQMLEGLGWKIVRVWSTDWFRDRNRARKDLLTKIHAAMANEQHVPGASGSGSTVPQATKSRVGVPRGSKGADVPTDRSSDSARDATAMPMQVVDRQVVDATCPPYEKCQRAHVAVVGDLAAAPRDVVAALVAQIVNTEGPIHESEVLARVRDLWHVQRAGARIQEAVRNAIAYDCGLATTAFQLPHASGTGEDARLWRSPAPIIRHGSFLWPVALKHVPVRHRDDPALARIELICDQEIANAAGRVLKTAYSAPMDDLVAECARMLGIRAVHDEARERIKSVIIRALDAGGLRFLPNEQIALPNGGGLSTQPNAHPQQMPGT